MIPGGVFGILGGATWIVVVVTVFKIFNMTTEHQTERAELHMLSLELIAFSCVNNHMLVEEKGLYSWSLFKCEWESGVSIGKKLNPDQ